MDQLYIGNTVLQNDKKQTAYCNLFSADMSVIVAGWGLLKQQKMTKDLHEVLLIVFHLNNLFVP
jgi:hypothetical protein